MNCFVIMPFSETSHNHNNNGNNVIINASEWNHIYEMWIKKAVESFPDQNIICKRSETVQGNFVKGIINDIYNSKLAIVDLTGQKPNVYYEMGIRHSLCLGTIIITQDFNALPSDLKSYYCFSYDYSDKSHLYEEYYGKFEKKLHQQISSIIINKHQSDNPVSDFLDLKHYNQIQECEKQVRLIAKITSKLNSHLELTIERFEMEVSKKKTRISETSLFFIFLDFYEIDTSVAQLFNLEFDYLNQDDIEDLRSFYINFRKDIYYIHQYWENTISNLNTRNIEILMSLMDEFLLKKDYYETLLTEIINRIIKD